MILLTFIALFFLFSAGWGANSSREFGGIGIDGVPLADGQIVVKQLVAGGPAHLAGVRVGDVITRIDSKPTRGSSFKDMVEHRLRGRAGTKVLLTVQRPGQEKPLHFTLVRKQLLLNRQP
ncbi:MAG TPA: PDZ domain-containing protein [Geobacteraceae bacterium]